MVFNFWNLTTIIHWAQGIGYTQGDAFCLRCKYFPSVGPPLCFVRFNGPWSFVRSDGRGPESSTGNMPFPVCEKIAWKSLSYRLHISAICLTQVGSIWSGTAVCPGSVLSLTMILHDFAYCNVRRTFQLRTLQLRTCRIVGWCIESRMLLISK